ncbi:hypothetical protein [Bradyrhizobium sp. CSA112]|nr:hypothetical protein [Bradyrhizobium sp. CSA112]
MVRAFKLTAGATEVVNQGEFICELPDGAKFVWDTAQGHGAASLP